MDFTLNKYRELLLALRAAGYQFYTFEQYLDMADTLTDTPVVILRHDVDKKPFHSLAVAELEAQLGIAASYYFRVVRASFRPAVMHAIAGKGHELGYHYEDMSLCHGDVDAAMHHFIKWLDCLRNFYPVRTICMHGAPTSRYDSRDLWSKQGNKHVTYHYQNYGIIGEPYFDIDFSQFFYLTDTGRAWDGYKVSVRDKIPEHQDEWIRRGWVFHSTDDIIRWLQSDAERPRKIMITTHPQRWSNNILEWATEYIAQSLKNQIKKFLA